MSSPLRRTVAITALVVALLGACSSDGDGDVGGKVVKDGVGCTKPEIASGKAPKAPEPTEVGDTVETTDVTKGDGCDLDLYPFRTIDMIGITGSGTTWIDTWADERPLSVRAGDLLDSIDTGMAGMKVGGVRTLAIPAALGYGEAGDPGAGVGPDEPLFLTVQLTGVSDTREYCRKPAPLPEGETEGKPASVDIPAKFPTEVTTEDLSPGEGEAAKRGDQVVIDYVGVSCATGAQFDASFDNGQPLTVTDLGGAGIIPGMAEGLIGVEEGGERLIQIPASQGYGDNPPSPDIAVGDNLVFYVKVRSVTAAADVTTTTLGSTTTEAGATTTEPAATATTEAGATTTEG